MERRKFCGVQMSIITPVAMHELYTRCYDDGECCNGCRYNLTTIESNGEQLRECQVLDVDDCPYADQYTQDNEVIE